MLIISNLPALEMSAPKSSRHSQPWLFLNIVIFYARETEAWQSIVRSIGDTIF